MAGVAEARFGGGSDCAVEASAGFEVQDDEGVAAAQFENAFLQIAAGDLGHRGPGSFAAGDRHSLYRGVLEDVFDVADTEKQVGVYPGWRSSVAEELFEGKCGLGTTLGVLHQEGVPGEELRGRDPHRLVQGEIPRLDSEQHAQGRIDEHRLTGINRQRLGFEVSRSVLGVVQQDAGDPCDLAATLDQPLTHLQRLQLGEFFLPFQHQLASAAQHPGALGYWPAAPGQEGLVGFLHDGVQLRTGYERKVLKVLAGARIDSRVSTTVARSRARIRLLR